MINESFLKETKDNNGLSGITTPNYHVSAYEHCKVLSGNLSIIVLAREFVALRAQNPQNRRSGDFFPANSKSRRERATKVRSSPDNRDSYIADGAKIHKRNRLPAIS
jgi:hypothetical protein